MTSKQSPETPKVDRDEFTRIINNLLKTPPKKHSDSKTGKKKSSKTIILPRTESQDQSQK